MSFVYAVMTYEILFALALKVNTLSHLTVFA